MEIVAQGKNLPTLKELMSMLVTFGLTVFAWIFFRADSMSHALHYISEIFSSSLVTFPKFPEMPGALTTIVLVILFLLVEWQGREHQYALAHLGVKWHKPLRWAMYYGIIFAIIYFAGEEQQFIYFQF